MTQKTDLAVNRMVSFYNRSTPTMSLYIPGEPAGSSRHDPTAGGAAATAAGRQGGPGAAPERAAGHDAAPRGDQGQCTTSTGTIFFSYQSALLSGRYWLKFGC